MIQGRITSISINGRFAPAIHTSPIRLNTPDPLCRVINKFLFVKGFLFFKLRQLFTFPFLPESL